MIVTIFKNIKEVSTPFFLRIEDILTRIENGNSKELITKIRTSESKEERNEYKKGLPSICFSGEFQKRGAKYLTEHSGLICLDFDNFESEEVLRDYKAQFSKDNYTMACFISPSGNGLKVLVKIPSDVVNHKRYFESLHDYYNTEHLDLSGSDVSRVCYESYDPELYVNLESEIYSDVLETKEHSYLDTTQNQKVPLRSEVSIIERLDKWGDKSFPIIEGERNQNLFKRACAFSEFGISQSTCENHFRKFETKGFNSNEITRTVQSAYKKTKHSFGDKFFEDTNISEYVNRQYLSGVSEENLKEELTKKGYDDSDLEILLDDAKKNDVIDVFWTISNKGKVTIISKKFKEYLSQNGFFKYYPNGSKNYVFVKVESNLIDFTTEENIKSFVLKELENKEHFEVYEYLAVATKYFKEDYLNLINVIDIALKEDTRNTSYCYYKNCVVEVTEKGLKKINYIDLNGYVWKDRVIDRDFEISNNLENDFKKFVHNIGGNDEKNIENFESTLGYLLHSYKNKGYSPAIILNDEVISENPEGGTGKGLLVTALSNMKRVTILDGKTFDKNKSFAYQVVTTSTEILVFDDVKKKFDFEGLFSLITEGITLEKKNKDAIKLDFYQSPKILITTNYAIKGKGNSHDRRKWELELAQHYSMSKTPLDEFGRLLFDEWTKKDWLAFDNYMLNNLKNHLKFGFIKSSFKNIKVRKFINETSFEFYQWCEDAENELIITERVPKGDLFEHFVNEYDDYKKFLRKKTFRNWLQDYAKFKGIEFIEGNSNGARWCTLVFTDRKVNELEEIAF